jgi:hypothetical protein
MAGSLGATLSLFPDRSRNDVTASLAGALLRLLPTCDTPTASRRHTNQTTTDFAQDTEIEQRSNTHPSKGETTTQKESKFILIILLSKSTPHNSL